MMYQFFNPVLKLEHSHAMNEDYKIYISFEKMKLSAIEDLLQFTNITPNGEWHFDFIQEYAQTFRNHINYVSSSMNSLSLFADEVLDFLNDNNNLVEESFELNGLKYYISFESDSYYIFTSLSYDKFLEKESYAVFEIQKTSKGYKLIQSAVGFTTKNIDDLRKHPSYIKEQIEKFNSLLSVEQLKEHKDYCENLIKRYFKVNEIYDLFELRDSLLAKILGNPMNLLREITSSYNKNIIKTCLLNNELNISITKELIQLILNERNIKDKDNHKDILEDKFEEYCNKLEQTKMELMSKLPIPQDTLDKYMSYLPDDF